MYTNVSKIIVSALILDKVTQKILLGKRSMDEEVFPGYWSAPGGTVEFSDGIEQNVLEDNLKREIHEELGIEVEIDKYLSSVSTTEDTSTKVYMFYKVYFTKGDITLNDELISAEWFEKEKALNLEMLTPGAKQLIKSI